MGIVTALVFFGALTWIITALRESDDHSDVDARAWVEVPSRLPNPGPRDLHAVTGGTLGRAHVPSWGC
jgi:hypothetical protein